VVTSFKDALKILFSCNVGVSESLDELHAAKYKPAAAREEFLIKLLLEGKSVLFMCYFIGIKRY